jgi:hypothetical protein
VSQNDKSVWTDDSVAPVHTAKFIMRSILWLNYLIICCIYCQYNSILHSYRCKSRGQSQWNSTQELLRIIQELLRDYWGTTEGLFRDYLGITFNYFECFELIREFLQELLWELLRNYCGIPGTTFGVIDPLLQIVSMLLHQLKSPSLQNLVFGLSSRYLILYFKVIRSHFVCLILWQIFQVIVCIKIPHNWQNVIIYSVLYKIVSLFHRHFFQTHTYNYIVESRKKGTECSNIM